MSNKNYMGKIDEDATGKSEPDYDDFSSINRDKEEHKKISHFSGGQLFFWRENGRAYGQAGRHFHHKPGERRAFD